ncbi:hypothetical protein ACIRNI_06565 [Streptomyces sp. NPDC093546]|uniref:hypothetical protein n=1 Tax=Streptomyces sp. NPDC093546 TaxID=3366040 RepID=UPI003808F975
MSKVVGVVLPTVLVLGAVVGGVTYTKNTVDRADRTTPTVLWAGDRKPPDNDPAGEVGKGRSSTPMSKLLMPVPEGYSLGPDIREFGNDGEMDGKQAAAFLKDAARGLTGKDRKDAYRRIDQLGLQGIAARSYATSDDRLWGGSVLFQVQIVRMKDRSKIRDLHRLRVQMAEALNLEAGPKIKGRTNVGCYTAPSPRGFREQEGLGHVLCTAYEGDLSVTLEAWSDEENAPPLIAELVQSQLDHIKSPGEYV